MNEEINENGKVHSDQELYEIFQKTILQEENDRTQFSFSEPHFDGRKFYEKYKDADFLEDPQNVRNILGKYYELRQFYDGMQPGEEFEIKNMFLEPSVPLVLKKSMLVDESDINQDDFTLRRLTGFLAAYVYRTEKKYSSMYCEESRSFGLKTPDIHFRDCGIYFHEYLSAISGAEYFVSDFNYYPFIFALRRLQLNQISEELFEAIANIRHPDTLEPIVAICAKNYDSVCKFTKKELGFIFNEALSLAPQKFKRFFVKP